MEGWIRTGSVFVNPDALSMGNVILGSAGTGRPDLIVVDEVGPFELKGLVWHDALTELVGNCASAILWVVRAQIAEEVINRWELDDPIVLNPSVHSMEQAFKLILSVLGKGNNWTYPEKSI